MTTSRTYELKIGTSLLLLLAATILFHSIEFRTAVWNIDEYIFATGGQKLHAGGTLYKDFGDNKPPLIYETYALIYGLSGGSFPSLLAISKSFKIIAVFLTALGLYYCGTTLYGRMVGMMSGMLFAGYSICAQSSEILGGKTEIYAALFTVVSICFFVRKRFAFTIAGLGASGLSLSLAALYNTRFGIVIAAYCIFIVYRFRISGKSIRIMMPLLVSFLLPLVAVPLYYYRIGEFDYYRFWQTTVFKYYLTAFPLYMKFVSGFLVLYFLAGIAPVVIFAAYSLVRGYRDQESAAPSGVVARLRAVAAWNEKNEAPVFLAILLLCMYAAFFAGGIPGVRYFFMMLIPLCILGAEGFMYIFTAAKGQIKEAGISRLISVILAVFLLLPPSFFYLIHWNNQRPPIMETIARYQPVADYIQNHTAPHDSIYIWYNVGPLYLFSNRIMATSMIYPAEFLFRHYYFTGDFMKETTAWDLFLKQLQKEMPALIIDDGSDFSAKKENAVFFHGNNDYAVKRAAGLKAFVRDHYTCFETIQGLKIYKKI